MYKPFKENPVRATLRERLRKIRSSSNSCYSVVECHKAEDEENDQTSPEKAVSPTKENGDAVAPQMISQRRSFSNKDSMKKKGKLVKPIQEKEDLLQRLKLVKMYDSGHDWGWRSFSLLLLYDVQSAVCENKKGSLARLTGHCRLGGRLPHYNRNEEEGIGVSFIIFSPECLQE
ncbi:unnamed protein product [Nyctereutes procyonoides]|uniref:Swi5-dependent recombination DNA repair protein 1 homolog n=1 Tax=Nyctereutes procyonoides TaxID=34880 RepID=A0A811Y4H7_NYCPR|nr:unnamed protein product [Nyctereutes procyonoides]